MSITAFGMIVLYLFLFLYIVIASIDFGAGIFILQSKLRGAESTLVPIIGRYLNPIWEVTNVFLVFFTVGIVGFFPDFAYYYGSVLLVPGSIALILLTIRGSFYAFQNYGPDSKFSWLVLHSVSGLFIPAALSMGLVISEGGYIHKTSSGTGVDLNWLDLFFSPFAWAVVFLALVSVMYISSGFLAYYARKAENMKAYNIIRMWFVFWGPPMALVSLFTFITLRSQNKQHFDVAVNQYWWLFLISILCLLAAWILSIMKKSPGTAFMLVVIQMATAVTGYGLSKWPYILYPYINGDIHKTDDPMAWALTIAAVVGLLMLVPSLIFLMRLFIFNKDYVEGKNDEGYY